MSHVYVNRFLFIRLPIIRIIQRYIHEIGLLLAFAPRLEAVDVALH